MSELNLQFGGMKKGAPESGASRLDMGACDAKTRNSVANSGSPKVECFRSYAGYPCRSTGRRLLVTRQTWEWCLITGRNQGIRD
jgi:hypothetical protein